jgi:outer membrane protein assembly factor BamA
MRRDIAQIVIFAAACLLAVKPHIRAQSAPCPPRSTSAANDKQPSGPEISIAEVTFSGFLQMPISDQDQIAASIKQQTFGTSLDGVTDEAVERVKAGWQDRGYFRVQVSGTERTLTSSPAIQRIAFSFDVEEGLQYSLGEITFKNNKVISDAAALRSLFPISDGDIFSREKIATGLEALRWAYGDKGYINFTSVPDTKFDDEKRLVTLAMDLDEGKQFRIGDFNVVGLDELTRQELLKDFPLKRGQVYDYGLFKSFILRHPSISAPNDPNHIYRRLDERAGTVAITLDARPCPVD